MANVDFLHQENLLAWTGVKPATFGTAGQRQTNYATQLALLNSHNQELTIEELIDMHEQEQYIEELSLYTQFNQKIEC
ncbi:hypothetical protein TNCV_3750151 [Trichonephila clavipes]|nr:hypothetical protein TNCV_3750151 [Trichonephila clavipes]